VLADLAPRRRALLGGGVAVVVVAIIVGVVVATSGGGSLTGPPVSASAAPGPIVIVPGYGGSTSGPDVLAAALRATGRDVTVMNLPGDGTGDLRAQADVLATTVSAVLSRTHAASVDVVGYSAGSIVTRIYVQDMHGFSRVRRVVTLGAPNHGTDLAATAGSLVPGACVEACAQLEPDSSVLAELNARPLSIAVTSIYTEDDQTVTPPTTAVLAGAVDIDLQSVCPGVTVSHAQLPTDPHVQAIVAAELGTAPQSVPTACPG